MSTSPMTLTLDFQGQTLKIMYFRNGRADWHGTKGMWVDRMLHPLWLNFHLAHGLDIGFSRSNFKKVISQEWHSRLTWDERDVSRENNGSMLWLSTFPSLMTLTLDFQGQMLKMLYLRNRRADWHGTKGMWVDRMLHPLGDFQLWPQPWPWPLIFKVKFWKSPISGMGWPIDMGWKGCESIECWNHVMTLNLPLTHDLDLGFSMSNFEKVVSQEWDGWFTWNERDVSRYDVAPTLWLSTLTSTMTLTFNFQGQILKNS